METADRSWTIPLYIFVILTISAISMLIIYIPYLVHSCYIYQSIYSGIYLTLYSIQYLFSILFWICRLYFVFDGTLMPLSSFTLIFWMSFYIILTFISIIEAIAYALKKITPAEYATFTSIAFCLTIAGSIGLSFLFAFKLITLHKSFAVNGVYQNNKTSKTNKNNDKWILDIVSKLLILTWINLIITFFLSITIGLRLVVFPDSILMEFIGIFAAALDPYSNFLCIILSYSHYHKVYLKICCLHSFCFKCWRKCANVTMAPIELGIYIDNQSQDTINPSPSSTNASNIELSTPNKS